MGRRLVTYSPKVFIPLTKLCRDVCHYCTFAQPPRRGERAYMSADEVLAVAREGAEAGCHEALFTLGDKPELRYRAAREELAALGCATTIEYLERMAGLVLSETGLLPHLNPGVMTREDLLLLRPVSASMGLMLESTSLRLAEKGRPHHGSPDKLPAARLETIRLAGELAVPFTTGILIGIGETRDERLEALEAIAALHERHGHIQEVIVQNFRAKPGTKMAAHAEPSLEELIWTARAAREILPGGRAPAGAAEPLLRRVPAAARVRDRRLGRRLPGDDRPRQSGGAVARDPAAARGDRGARLRAGGAPAHLPGVRRRPRALGRPARSPPEIRRHADASGLAREERWAAGAPGNMPALRVGRRPTRSLRAGRGALAQVEAGAELDEDAVTALFEARGADLGAVLAAADELRREVCGDEVSYVVTRNVNYTNVCYFRCGFCAFSKGKLAANLRGKPYVVPLAEIVRRAEEAWERGAVEICLQGGIHPAFTGETYLEICAAVKEALPDLHVHAFSALEVWQGAATLDLPLEDYLGRLRDVGLASLPGTAAEILDDEVRRTLCPDKVSTGQWLEVHDAAHRVGLRSTTTVMFGSVEGPRSWARHLLALRDQQRRSGGFTEFVPLPFVHMEAPIYLKGRRRPGPTFREAVLMHAVGRLALHPWITNVQASWVKLGIDGAQAALRAGANDLGGTLMNESISRAAGAAHGQEMPPEGMEDGDPRDRPHAAPADDALRHAGPGAHPPLLRRAGAHRAAEPERQRREPEAPTAPRPPGPGRVRLGRGRRDVAVHAEEIPRVVGLLRCREALVVSPVRRAHALEPFVGGLEVDIGSTG